MLKNFILSTGITISVDPSFLKKSFFFRTLFINAGMRHVPFDVKLSWLKKLVRLYRESKTYIQDKDIFKIGYNVRGLYVTIENSKTFLKNLNLDTLPLYLDEVWTSVKPLLWSQEVKTDIDR